jgi:hypothetical protein
MQRYEEGGLPALSERSHKPKSCPHQIDPGTEDRIVTLRRGRPRRRRIRLLDQLECEKVAVLPSHIAVYRTLVRPGGDRDLKPCRRGVPDRCRFQVSYARSARVARVTSSGLCAATTQVRADSMMSWSMAVSISSFVRSRKVVLVRSSDGAV